MHNAHQNCAWKRPTSALQPAVWSSQNKYQPMTDYMTNLVEWLYDSHHCACQDLKMASNKIKAHYSCIASYVGFQEGNRLV